MNLYHTGRMHNLFIMELVKYMYYISYAVGKFYTLRTQVRILRSDDAITFEPHCSFTYIHK